MELFKPEFGLVFWMFIAFACLYFILAKCAWPFIVKMMEQRADLIVCPRSKIASGQCKG